MKSVYTKAILLLLTLIILRSNDCKGPYYPPLKTIEGNVIAKESCKSDESQDYWILDFKVDPNSPKVGDTIAVNGITYTNALKLQRLEPSFRQAGKKVAIDYIDMTPYKVITLDCTVASPVTYDLKEVFIVNQREIR